MKLPESIQILFIAFVLSITSSFASAGQFRVKWIYDGDTFKAAGNDIEIVVRFVAIDAPEISYRKGEPSQPFGDQSKRMLMDLILNKTVEIKGYGIDKQNRVLAVVYYGGRNVGVEMVREGLAEIYRGELPEGLDLRDYRQAEFRARTSRQGMWIQGDAYVSPRDWRDRERRR
ncbi:MAG: thermonuclease family protein [Deltaproteobacteria bacterium]|nr:thermonuclease family protein [Deltaproteobacteria bacterium]